MEDDLKEKISTLCGNVKCMVLEEITTVQNNQLEHVLLDKNLSKTCFATAFFNLGSDHKSVVLRIGKSNSGFTKEFLEMVNFDEHHHLKSRKKFMDAYRQEKINSTGEGHQMKNTGLRNKTERICKPKPKDGRNIINKESLILLSFLNPPGKNLCFSNVVASSLLNIPIFKDYLLAYVRHEKRKNSITEELSTLVKLRSFNKASTQQLRSIVKLKCFEAEQLTKNFNNNKQHDSGEFMLALFEHVWNEQFQSTDTLREALFGGISQDILNCLCGNSVELNLQHMTEIVPIQVISGSLQIGLENIFSKEKIYWKCPKCERPTVDKSMSIVQEPSTLILQLLRYGFDANKKEAYKVQDPVDCPQNLVLPSGTSYSFSSVINHIGEETHSGHYNMILSDRENNEFVLLDDTEITFIPEGYFAISDVSYIFVYVKDLQ